MSVTATINAKMDLIETGSSVLGNTPKWSGSVEFFKSLASGTGLDQCDLVYANERTVADGANDDIDLAGVLSSPLGNTIAGAELVALFVINQQKDGTANTTTLTVGAAAANPFAGFLGSDTDTIGPLQPGASLMLVSGHASGLGAIAAGTDDILRIANSAGAANTYQIVILARSA